MLNLSPQSKKIKDPLSLSPDEFKKIYQTIRDGEKEGFLRYFLIENTPFVFQTEPLIFEQVKHFLANRIDIHPKEVVLIGSAKTGFSISPDPEYGRPFSSNSDLDLAIVSEDLFIKLSDEFYTWREDYERKIVTPNNAREKRFWDDNKVGVGNNIKKGFIDSNKIPNLYPNTSQLNDSLFRLKRLLHIEGILDVRDVSARVYNSWYQFTNRLKHNTENSFK